MSNFCINGQRLCFPVSGHGIMMFPTIENVSENEKSMNLYSVINQALYIALETNRR